MGYNKINNCDNCNLTRKHKDSMFRVLFNNKKNIIELYNAITGAQYDIDTEVKFETIEEVIFEKLKNDIAFTIDDKFVVLVEHQSTVNENMAIRDLIYYTDTLRKIEKKELYLKKKKIIPEPVFIVLYNGLEDNNEYWEIQLKNNFKQNQKNALNLTVEVYNINKGKNKKILDKCKTLSDYSFYIDAIRNLEKDGLLSDKAIKQLNDDCIKEGILPEFLLKHGTEAYDMIYEALTDEDIKAIYTENGRIEGREEGKAEEKLEIARKMKKMKIKISDIAKATGLTKEQICEL